MKSKIFILLALLQFFYSCEDVLERAPLDKISDADVWKDESLLQGYVINLYSDFPHFSFDEMYRFGDESTASWGNATSVTTGTMNRDNIDGTIEYWNYGYIRDINIFLEKINNAPVSEELKKQLEGELRAMRANVYFELAKRYGGVPLVTQVIDPFKAIDPELQKRKKEVEIYDFVDSEYTKAVQLLGNTLDTKPIERINKWSALALQARANLWAASIAKYGKVELDGLTGVPANRANEFFKKASDAASAVLNSGKYSLYKGNADKSINYQNIFLSEQNSEMIFVKAYDNVSISHYWDWTKAPGSIAGEGSKCNPTLELILSYENIDGSTEDYTKYFSEKNLYTNGMDIFKNKDPRLFATVLFQGSPFAKFTMQMYEGIDTGDDPNPNNIVNNPSLKYQGYSQVGIDSRLTIGDDRNTNSGFLIRKFCDEPNVPVPQYKSQVDWPNVRLAELYLTKAEAEFELGNSAAAVPMLNATRERAGISLVNQSNISMKKIQNEWMVEFAFENRRFWDLRRWRIAESVLNNHQFNGLKTIWHYKSNKYYFLPLKCETFSRVFRPEYYYNPFSSSKVSNNPFLVQNPLY